MPQGVGVRVPSSAPNFKLIEIFNAAFKKQHYFSKAIDQITKTLDITQVSTGDLTAAITISLAPEDYKGKVNDELKKQARKANMPGFRPGKVPVGVVRKMVGKAVVIEEVTKTVSDKLSDYIEEEKIKILGDPIPREQKSEEDFDEYCEKEMEFIFDVGLAPEFEINFDLPSNPPLYEIEIDDEFLNKEIENYQDRFADVTNPEDVGEGDIVYGKLSEVDGEGNVIEDGFEKMMALNPARTDNQDIFKAFIGKKLEESVEFDPFTISDDIENVKKELTIEDEDVDALKEKKFQFEVKRVNRVTNAELNEEFFKKVADSLQWENAEEIKEEADFKAKLSEHLKKDMKDSTKWHFRNETQKQLIEIHEMSFPEEFLKKWLKESNKNRRGQGQPPLEGEELAEMEKQVEEEFPEFLKSLKWSLIVGKVNEDNPETVVESEELRDGIKEYLTERYAQFEGGQISDQQIEEYLNYTLQNEELVRMHYKRMSDEKLYDFLSDKITGDEKSISATEFTALIQPDNAA